MSVERFLNLTAMFRMRKRKVLLPSYILLLLFPYQSLKH